MNEYKEYPYIILRSGFVPIYRSLIIVIAPYELKNSYSRLVETYMLSVCGDLYIAHTMGTPLDTYNQIDGIFLEDGAGTVKDYLIRTAYNSLVQKMKIELESKFKGKVDNYLEKVSAITFDDTSPEEAIIDILFYGNKQNLLKSLKEMKHKSLREYLEGHIRTFDAFVTFDEED